jgi:hypothetical protein
MAIPSYATPVDDETPSTWKAPSYATLAEGPQAPAPQEGFLGKALDVFAPGVGSLASMVSQNPQTILPALSVLARSVPNAAANFGAGLMSTVNPGFGNVVSSLAQQVPTPSPETSNLLGFAANTALAVPGIEALPELGALAGAGKQAILRKLGSDVNEKATNFARNLIGDQKAVKKQFRDLYGSVGDQATSSGYQEVEGQIQKPIEKNLFDNAIINLSPENLESFFSKMPGDKQKIYDRFLNAPSYDNAHDLQTALGRYGIQLLKNRETAMLGRDVLDTRNALNQDIANTFNKYGDSDLAQMRQDISKQYAQNEQRLLLADKLKSGITNLPGQGIQADAQKIVNAYGKTGFKGLIGRFEKEMKTPETDAAIADIMQSLSRKDFIDKFKAPLIAGLAGAAGVGGAYHFGREFF